MTVIVNAFNVLDDVALDRRIIIAGRSPFQMCVSFAANCIEQFRRVRFVLKWFEEKEGKKERAITVFIYGCCL